MSLKPGQQFSHYRLVEKIGEGGMGIVWRAEDTVLQRQVAIKFLRGDVSRDELLRERFLREARLASSLSHAHIAQVHDFGRDQDLDFLVMEYIEGEPLSRTLRGRSMPVHRIADIGCQVAQALARAHRNHLLHRDLKPANILINSDGDVKVVDFGLARLFRREDSMIGADSTTQSLRPDEVPGTSQTGIAGTLPYMSPEQVRGDKLDARSDIFSLGTILYEMTTGREPFIGSSNLEIAREIEACQPPPVHDFMPRVPLDLDRTIQKAMARQRADRYQTMEDMAVDLKRLCRELRSGSAPSYDDLHPEPEAKSLITNNGLLAALLIVALGVAGWYLWPIVTGVDANGFSEQEGLPGQPGEPATEFEVFFNRGMHYLLREEETARSIDDAIHMFHRAVDLDPENATAWAVLGEAYWRRYARWGGGSASGDEAGKAVSRALMLDPELAEAHHAKGYGFIVVGDYPAAAEELKLAVAGDNSLDRSWAILGLAYRKLGDYQSGLAALKKSVELKPGNFLHRIRLGKFYDRFSEHEAALVEFEQALILKPDSAMAWNNKGGTLLKLGRNGEAETAFHRAFAIEETASARSNLGTKYYFMGNYEKAVENYRRAGELDPESSVHWANLGDALKMLQRQAESVGAYRRAVEFARQEVSQKPGDAAAHADLGLYCARVGDTACALEEGRQAAELAPTSAETLFQVAIILHLAGVREDALSWLEEAVHLGLTRAGIENDPDLANLRDDPRYQRILSLAS